MLTFKKVKRHLHRLRDKKYPKRPKTDEDIRDAFNDQAIKDEFGTTLDQKRSLYVDSVIEGEGEEKFAFHVFASHAMIKIVEEQIPPGQRKYLIDGTFRVTPEQFKKNGQLLIIAIEYKNDVCILYSQLNCSISSRTLALTVKLVESSRLMHLLFPCSFIDSLRRINSPRGYSIGPCSCTSI